MPPEPGGDDSARWPGEGWQEARGLPKQEVIWATALKYLQEGNEKRAELLLEGCRVEVAGVRVLGPANVEVDVTLRCGRELMEAYGLAGCWGRESGVMEQVREAVESALPAGYGVGAMAARMALVTGVNGKDGGRRRAEYVFRKVGREWMVGFEGRPAFRLVDTLGAQYLDHVLHRPNVVIRATELEAAVLAEHGKERPVTTMQPKLDEAAKKEYQKRLAELKADLDEAVAREDHEAAEQAEAEMEALTQELKGTKLGSESGNRARDSVRKAVTWVLDRLERGTEDEQAFAKHVRQAVSLGFEVVYQQPAGKVWG